MERKAVRPGSPDSYEETLFHRWASSVPFYLTLSEGRCRRPLKEQRLERAIGVIYLPKRNGIAITSMWSCLRSSTPCSLRRERVARTAGSGQQLAGRGRS